ncbi:TetR/AcrR family transcriptional regulator [Altererythrobacter lauratis]|uniref:TetR/AcrR family transcriptional regulator n=1 Tax=Alteraurantiacibacter lauratis TaxID=2054627 RepID=A0ABV7ED08_9SPHN
MTKRQMPDEQIDVEKTANGSEKAGKRRSGRKPGRPKKDGGLKERILDEAELAFAKTGFAGTSTRDIAKQANVNQGLIRYYFESKEQLYKDVFHRRGEELAGRRHVLLDRLLASKPDYTVEDVIRAYLEPQWDLKYSNASGAAFVTLQARIHAEKDEQSLALRREIYDAPVKRYIGALVPLLPHLSREVVSLRMAFLVGTYLFMLNDLGRIEDLSQGKVIDLGKEEMLDNLVLFLAAGLRADSPE